MRFSLRHLLMLFPAYILSIFIAVLLMRFVFAVRVSPSWTSEISQPALVLWEIERHDRDSGRPPLSDDILNRWLEGSLSKHQLFDTRLNSPFRGRDVWGNPYRAVRNQTLPDGTVVELGVYSMGQDGVSLSNGNDPDDINSWSDSWRDQYERDLRASRRVGFGVAGLILLPFTYLLLFILPETVIARRIERTRRCG